MRESVCDIVSVNVRWCEDVRVGGTEDKKVCVCVRVCALRWDEE